MSYPAYKTFAKEPAEEFDITVDLSPLMKKGAVISSSVTGYPKATRVSDGVVTTTTVLGASAISGVVITQRVKAGADGEQHKIEWRVTDSNGEIHETGLVMEVIER